MHLTEVLDELNIDYRTGGPNTRDGWAQMECPWCGGNPYLGINLAYGYANCWRCSFIPLSKLLVTLAGITYETANQLLRGVIAPNRIGLRQTLSAGKLVLPIELAPLKAAHRAYLGSRGLNPARLVKLWGVQGIGTAPELAWRVWIPIRFRDEIVSWTTRSISQTNTRYISASKDQEKIDHKSLLFGEDYCRSSIVVVEGPLDAFKLGPGAVATFGVGYSTAQVNRMSRYPVRAICFDSEPKAQHRARELADMLAGFPGDTYVVTLKAKDPGSARYKEIQAIRERFIVQPARTAT